MIVRGIYRYIYSRKIVFTEDNAGVAELPLFSMISALCTCRNIKLGVCVREIADYPGFHSRRA